MTVKEESSFLQEVESRFDSLFNDDKEPIKEKFVVAPQAAADELSTDATEKNVSNILSTRAINHETEVSSGAAEAQTNSEFISEINRRFSEIFGDNNKTVNTVTESEKKDTVHQIIACADEERNKCSDGPQGDIPFVSDLSAVPSPLKRMQSVLLSLECEISDEHLEKLEDEVDNLNILYSDDRIIQGFLRILRFVGRYIKVRGGGPHQDSIDLLLSVFNHLQKVTVPDSLTKEERRNYFLVGVQNYKSWVTSIDPENLINNQAHETNVDHILSQLNTVTIDEDVEKMLADFKDLPPHEALTQTLDKMKKVYQDKIDALNKEIQMLKITR